MGVVLFTALFLAAISAYFEISIVRKLPFLKRFLPKVPLLCLIFSLVLSVGIGMIFGAAGLVVMIAGVFSTLIVQPVYWFMNARADGRYQIETWMRDFHATYRPVGIGMKYFFLALSSPIWGPVVIRRWWLNRS